MKSVIIKLSGESLSKDNKIVHEENILKYKKDLDYLISNKYKVILIIGGGNIIRGRDHKIDRAHLDQAGMLATMVNGMIIQSILRQNGYKCTLYSNVSCEFIDNASNILHDITIIVGGSGRIGFSTDITMMMIGMEQKPDYIFKLTNVKGVLDHNHKVYRTLSLQTMLYKNLLVIDRTAIAFAIEHNISFYILHINANIQHAIEYFTEGTYISDNVSDELYIDSNI